jgi:hypothetical protein
LHISVEVLFKAGMLPINTVGEPGVHGTTVTGIHGIGVKTPNAAAVADATVGLAIDEQTPKVARLTIGLLSKMVAAGVGLNVRFSGNTTNGQGATPNEH